MPIENNYLKVQNDFVIFDLEHYLNVQENIYRQFRLIGYAFDETTGFDMSIIDKYLMQIFEEIFECRCEIKTRDYEASISEALDVLAYLGSFVHLFQDFLSFYKPHPTCIPYKNLDYNEDDLSNTLNYIEDSLWTCRRLFPERKWHKTYSDKDINQNRFKILTQILFEDINKLLTDGIIPYIKMTDLSHLDEMITDKQKFIFAQKLVTSKK